MRRLIVTTTVLAMIGTPAVYARSGHSHRHQVHRNSATASATPDNPKKADARPPEKRDPEDTKIDKKIRSICQGC